ncbi:hypothetical protein GGP89_003547 [Salinibacter ruber]|jgi:hypothetical protein|uniref:Uncharacterized protein n=1 Tax=Salinibacter ruber TaxID=146919 RepID=A0A9X2U550_9BACT|nr:hypothetical protein [Salinibacter ruber]MCS3866970.1 hypothetical protein [Salinibacter ruber]
MKRDHNYFQFFSKPKCQGSFMAGRGSRDHHHFNRDLKLSTSAFSLCQRLPASRRTIQKRPAI